MNEMDVCLNKSLFWEIIFLNPGVSNILLYYIWFNGLWTTPWYRSVAIYKQTSSWLNSQACLLSKYFVMCDNFLSIFPTKLCWKYQLVCSRIISKNSPIIIRSKISIGLSVVTKAEIPSTPVKKLLFTPPISGSFCHLILEYLSVGFFSFLVFPWKYLQVFSLSFLQKLLELHLFLHQLCYYYCQYC